MFVVVYCDMQGIVFEYKQILSPYCYRALLFLRSLFVFGIQHRNMYKFHHVLVAVIRAVPSERSLFGVFWLGVVRILPHPINLHRCSVVGIFLLVRCISSPRYQRHRVHFAGRATRCRLRCRLGTRSDCAPTPARTFPCILFCQLGAGRVFAP